MQSYWVICFSAVVCCFDILGHLFFRGGMLFQHTGPFALWRWHAGLVILVVCSLEVACWFIQRWHAGLSIL